jgi:hypothetical protein
MLSFLKRKPEPTSEAVAPIEPPRTAETVRRGRQQNIKVSPDCAATFAAIAEAQGFSKAALFEDMVAERLEKLERDGVKFKMG